MATFRVPVAPSREKAGAGAESRAESRAESLEARVLAALGASELSKAEIAERLHLRTVSGQLNRTIRALVSRGLLALTIPGKPTSRPQKYRLAGPMLRTEA